MIAGVPIYAISPPFRRRTTLAVREALEGSLRRETPGLVVAPAGLCVSDDEDTALREAEALRAAARAAGAALVFALDVGPPQPGSIRLFACLGGAPVLWGTPCGRSCPVDPAPRALSIGGARVVALSAPEALDPLAPRRLGPLGPLGGILILSHGGATARWAPALARLERMAPIVVVAHHGGLGRAYATKSLGVRWLSMAERSDAQAALMV